MDTADDNASLNARRTHRRVFVNCGRVPPTTCRCCSFSSPIQSFYSSLSSSPLSDIAVYVSTVSTFELSSNYVSSPRLTWPQLSRARPPAPPGPPRRYGIASATCGVASTRLSTSFTPITIFFTPRCPDSRSPYREYSTCPQVVARPSLVSWGLEIILFLRLMALTTKTGGTNQTASDVSLIDDERTREPAEYILHIVCHATTFRRKITVLPRTPVIVALICTCIMAV